VLIQRRAFRAALLAVVTVAVVMSAGAAFAPPRARAASAPPVHLFVDGREVFPDVPPQVQSGRTLVPVRAVSEALGVRVAWDGERREVTLSDGSREVVLRPGDPEASAGGKPVRLDVPPVLVSDRVLVPLRFVAEALGCFVSWEPRVPAVSVARNVHYLPAASVPLSRDPVPAVDGALLRVEEPPAGLVGTDLRVRVAGRVTNQTCVKVWADIYALRAHERGTRALEDVIALTQERRAPLAQRLFEVSEDGRFSFDLWFPEGPGDYLVLLYGVTDYEESGGQVRWRGRLASWFTVRNWAPEARYLVSTELEDSDNPEVFHLAQEIVRGKSGLEAVAAVHDWVARNLEYDVVRYRIVKAGGSAPPLRASQVLALKKGVCSDYSRLACALLRAAGFRARVVEGWARAPGETWEQVLGGPANHAWNEVWVDGRWVTMDVTWDSGAVDASTGRFVREFSRKYFDPPPEVFALDHRKAEDGTRPE